MSDDILIIYPQINIPPHIRGFIELGVYAAALKHAQLSARIRVVFDYSEPDFFMTEIRENPPRIVMFYIQPEQFAFFADVQPSLKEAFPNIHFCCGGLMPTLDPESAVSVTGLDSLLLGEGESALVELTSAIKQNKDYRSLRNFWFRSSAQSIQKNPLRPLIENLDILPFADRSFYPFEQMLALAGGALPMLISRGCPHNCLFCPEPQLRDIYHGKGQYERIRSVNNIISEINQLRAGHFFKSVFFVDGQFALEENFLKEFSERYHAQINLPFYINSSIEYLNTKTLQLLAIAGCAGISIGIETGNETFRKRLCNKNVGNEKVLSAVKLARGMGLKIFASNIIGLPLETEELAEDTISFNEVLAPDRLSVRVFFPISGTPLSNYSKEKKYFSERNILLMKEDESVLNLPNLSSAAIKKYFHRLKRLNGRLQIGRKENPVGYYDLISAFCQIEPEQNESPPFICGEYFVGDKAEICLAQEPNTKIILPIILKKQVWLNILIGIEPTLRPFEDSAYFRFTLFIIQEDKESLVFDKYLNPAKNKGDLAWFKYEIPVLDFQEGDAVARFEYRTSLHYDYPIRGLWGRPFFTERHLQPLKTLPRFSENEFDQIRNELLQTKLILDKAHAEKNALVISLEKIKGDLEETLALAGKLQREVLEGEAREKKLLQKIEQLEKIEKAYNSSMLTRMKKIFKPDAKK